VNWTIVDETTGKAIVWAAGAPLQVDADAHRQRERDENLSGALNHSQ